MVKTINKLTTAYNNSLSIILGIPKYAVQVKCLHIQTCQLLFVL